MEGLRNISLILLIIAVLSNADVTTKEVRTTALSEKIIGGVIDLVHSHKNKPTTTPAPYPQTYPNQGYPPYPQYQQWNGQSYQGQGYNYQNQGQYGNYQNGYQGTTYPPNNGNYAPGQAYPAPAGGFNNGQTQSQGQYQIVYQNPPPNTQTQYGQNGQYHNTQSNQFHGQGTNSFQGQNQPTGAFQGQTQPSGTFQGQTQPSGTFQGQTYPTGSYPNQQTSNFQGQNGSYQNQGGNHGGGSSNNQNYLTGGHQASGNGQGPTCVCQAWTKPSETLNDPAAEKTEKMISEPSM
ncbi:uncharacterized protein [Epargyreus clarus]|uniref:uncharacterized protein isoform X2 n=1 Tax=Epargyreus clarus TaxID=520877 RepID=UPI003C2D37F8